MAKKLVRKTFMTLGLLFLLPVPAFTWNQATHAYISDALAARAGHDNLQEMWGSVMPDFYNYLFDPAVCPGWVSDQTHGMAADTFLKVWSAAGSEKEEALAYGFVSHNNAWGADHVAHEASLTFGSDEGYVIAKARLLLNLPVDPAAPHPTFGEVFAGSFGMNPDEALLVAHAITEYAIDIRMGREVDPSLGRKLAASARGETRRFTDLLVEAYAADYADACFGGNTARATSVLTAAEKEHREDMIYLGEAISRQEPLAVKLLAEQLVAVLPDLLGAPLPANTQEIMEAGISTAMAVCDDYLPEIEATIEFVAGNLEDHRIIYEYQGKAAQKGETTDVLQEMVVCTGWHALCSASFDCKVNGDQADCDCMRVNETHIVLTSDIQDPAVKRATLDQCTDKHPCDVDEAPVCEAIGSGQYQVDHVNYDWVSTFSYRGWCSLLEKKPQPCDQKENDYSGDLNWAVCDGAPCTGNPDPFDPERPLTCQCRVEEGPFVGINGSCTGDNGGIMSSSPLETWNFQANTYRIPVPGLEYVQGACAPLTSDPQRAPLRQRNPLETGSARQLPGVRRSL